MSSKKRANQGKKPPCVYIYIYTYIHIHNTYYIERHTTYIYTACGLLVFDVISEAKISGFSKKYAYNVCLSLSATGTPVRFSDFAKITLGNIMLVFLRKHP